MTGYLVDGGYAEYAKANARFVGKVPDGVDPLEAGPLTCAGVTAYKAVKVSGAGSSDLVAVFGIGGLGHLAVQYAAIARATVIAVDLFDLFEEKLNLAKELGATHTIDACGRGWIWITRNCSNSQSMSFIPKREPKKHSAPDCTCALLQLCTMAQSEQKSRGGD